MNTRRQAQMGSFAPECEERVKMGVAFVARRGCRRWGSTKSGEDLIHWVKQQGGKVAALEEQQVSQEGGRGLAVTQDVKAGDTLVALPPHLPLPLKSANPMLLALFDRIPEQLWTVKLALNLLAERTKLDSFWMPYIHNLPQRFAVPIFFSADEVQALQYPPLIHQVKKRCRFLLQFAKEDIPATMDQMAVNEHPFNNYQVDPGALGWAMAAVSSRAFHLHKLGGGPSLLPLVDMCNHSFTPTGRLVQYGSPASPLPVLEVVAAKDIQKGESLVLDYGPLSNEMLLLDYGFVVPRNLHDRVELRFDHQLLDAGCNAAGVSSFCSLRDPAPWKQAILDKLELDESLGSAKMVTLGGAEIVDSRLLAAVRVMHAKDVDRTDIIDLKALQEWGSSSLLQFVDEDKVIRTLVGISMLALANFPTSISEDIDILHKGDLSENLKLAIQFRMVKKELLIETIRNLQVKLEALQTNQDTPIL